MNDSNIRYISVLLVSNQMHYRSANFPFERLFTFPALSAVNQLSVSFYKDLKIDQNVVLVSTGSANRLYSVPIGKFCFFFTLLVACTLPKFM